jgi:type I restriction enzyme S subunit
MASVKDMTPFGINLYSCRKISSDDFEKLVRQGCQPKVGDVLIAKDGATALDTVCEVKKSLKAVLLSSIAILRPDRDKVTTQYLRYYLDAEPTREYMKAAFTTGAAIPRVVLKDFKRAQVRYPEISLQRKITSILSAYDDLIENNLRRIKILEEIARSLYREWFVKFRFPGHQKVKMVNSPLGKIPEGWEVKRLGELIELAYGKALKEQDRIQGGVPVYGSSGVVGFHNQSLVEGPGIIVGRKGNVGSVHWTDSPFFAIDTVFYVITELPLYYVYFNLRTQNFISGDAAVPGLNRNQAYSLPFILPTPNVLRFFSQTIEPIFHLLNLLKRKNDVLRQTRDLLLPKLISGELDVSELDITIPEVNA